MPLLRKSGSVTGYIVSSDDGYRIYCTDGQWYAKTLVGPGGYCAKVFKTLATATRARKRLGSGATKLRIEPVLE